MHYFNIWLINIIKSVINSEEFKSTKAIEKEIEKEETKWVCSVCGYVHKGDNPPEKCPLCGVPAARFNKQ